MRKNPDPPMAIHLDLCVLRYNWAPILRLTYLFPCILSSAGPNALPIISLKSQARVPVLQKSERRFEMVAALPRAPRLSYYRMRTNTAEYRDGYTNAPIVQTFPSAFNARSEVESPKALQRRMGRQQS
jgi:hypothetical protein